MAEYYVVRNKNTGLYFRGKGANRWGKYYNQASVYRIKANAENTIKEVSWHGEKAEVVPIQIIEGATDVAEVVRCKDCKHWTDTSFDAVTEDHWGECRKPLGDYRYCDTAKNDFCSYGERKE